MNRSMWFSDLHMTATIYDPETEMRVMRWGMWSEYGLNQYKIQISSKKVLTSNSVTITYLHYPVLGNDASLRPVLQLLIISALLALMWLVYRDNAEQALTAWGSSLCLLSRIKEDILMCLAELESLCTDKVHILIHHIAHVLASRTSHHHRCPSGNKTSCWL